MFLLDIVVYVVHAIYSWTTHTITLSVLYLNDLMRYHIVCQYTILITKVGWENEGREGKEGGRLGKGLCGYIQQCLYILCAIVYVIHNVVCAQWCCMSLYLICNNDNNFVLNIDMESMECQCMAWDYIVCQTHNIMHYTIWYWINMHLVQQVYMQ